MDNKTLPFSRGPNWQQHYQQLQIVSILPGEFLTLTKNIPLEWSVVSFLCC